MATSLIEAMSSTFKPGLYRDEYERALREIIESKLKGREIPKSPEVKETTVVDLMESLKTSLESAEKRRAQTSAT